MSNADRTLTCRDCGAQFIFTAGEQEFYAQKGFANDPTRCPNCRRARKSASGGGGYSSGGGGYSRSSYDSEDSYSSRQSVGVRSTSERQMFTTTCAECGKECQVPFIPRGSKPVLCDDCFRRQRGR